MSRKLEACDTALVVAQDVSWVFPDGVSLFADLSFAIEQRKIGLIGRNGVGKSQLLKLLVGEQELSSGVLETRGKVAYLPQNFSVGADALVADALQVRRKLDALRAIEQGSYDGALFDLLADDWDLEVRLTRVLAELGLSQLDLDRRFATLSGGEATRVYLAGLMLQQPDVLVLDEPTNNLDLGSKTALYEMIAQWRGALLVVSHDRSLLNLVDRIMELSTLGLKVYEGDYDAYLEQKAVAEEALRRNLKHAQIELSKTKRDIQKIKEKHQQKQAKGRRERLTGSQPMTVLNGRREQSERTASSINRTAERQLDTQRERLDEVRAQVEALEQIDVSMVQGDVPKGKVVLDIQNLRVGYGSGEALLDGFDLKVIGPERIWIKGPNGCGKTTLFRAMQQAQGLSAHMTADLVKVGVSRVVYLDQHIRVLDEDQSIIANFARFQPEMGESGMRWRLAKFLFKGEAVYQKVRQLSGGERLRAAMACLFMHHKAPHLLLLDEPTNHLDVDGVASLEAILQQYRGALLVISHDPVFVANVGVDRVVDLGVCVDRGMSIRKIER